MKNKKFTLPRRVKVGRVIKSKKGKRYKVSRLDNQGGFFVIRLDSKTPSEVKISGQLIEATSERVSGGECPCFQASQNNGGIAYTSAIETAVAFALNLVPDESTRTWVPKK